MATRLSSPSGFCLQAVFGENIRPGRVLARNWTAGIDPSWPLAHGRATELTDQHRHHKAKTVRNRIVLCTIFLGSAVIDERHARKQPDWSYDETDSGQSPADRRHELSTR